MKIDSADKSIGNMLNFGYYCIPKFQRPYSWDKENILDFWNDAIAENESDYFIGSMVIYTDTKSDDHFFVVDGQHRLNTITILLAVLRDVLSEEGFGDKAKGLHNLIEKENIDFKKEFVLQTETSYPFFQEKIQKYPQSSDDIDIQSEEEQIKRAYQLLRTQVSDAVSAINKDTTIAEKHKKKAIEGKLMAIRNSILNLKLILISLENEDDAYIIFETLNTRGKDLSVVDLVKNHLFKAIKPRNANVDRTKDKWQEILSTIEDSSESLSPNKFLLHFWLSKNDFISEKKLFKKIKESTRSEKEALQLIEDLVANARHYRSISETDFHKWKSEEQTLKNSLIAMSTFNVAQPIPAILTGFRLYSGGKIKLKNAIKLMQAIENFHFVFSAVTSQRASGGISQMYSSYARNMEKYKDDYKALSELIISFNKRLREKRPKFDEFAVHFREIIFTNEHTKQSKLVRYILRKIQNEFLFPGLPIDAGQASIEHIASQSSDIPLGACGQLGNMLLVSTKTNSDDLKAKDFKKKIDILKKSGLQLDNDPLLNSATEWTEEMIRRRTDVLAKISYDTVWKL